jgi:hypothetical protein
MYRKKVMTAGLAVLAIVTAISLVTASSNSGLVTSAFAVKKGGGNSGTSSSGTSSSSTSKKGTSSTGSTSTGSESKFIKCVTAISGSPSKAQVDNCWDQVFGNSSGLTLGGGRSTTSSGSSSGSSGHGGASTSGSST